MLVATLTAFLAGAAVLVVELAATRALAPFFGQALFVWTNVIGLVMLGLALGSLVGGRWADRRPDQRVLAWLLVAAAVLVAGSAFLAPLVSRALLPDTLPLEASFDFLRKGSFVATFLCFVPPVLLLGAVPPFLVRCAASRLDHLGARAGQLYGASTLGSILGCFLTSYVLLPALGTRGTLLLAAGLLALAAVPLWLGHRRAVRAVATLLLAAGLMSSPAVPAVRAAVGGTAAGTLLDAVDSSYQHVEVRYREDLQARVLALDEGHDSFHSVLPDEGVLTGQYYDAFHLVAAAARADQRLEVLILGFAAGTHARQLLHFFADVPGLRITGVELDPVVVEMGRKWLGLEDDPRLLVVAGMDARPWLQASTQRFDLVIVDCYAHQSYLPFHLASQEFFREVRDHLREGGYVATNLSGYGMADPVLQAVTGTMGTVFADGLVVARIPDSINYLVYARRGLPPVLPQDLVLTGRAQGLEDIRARLASPVHAWRQRERTGPLLTDDSGVLDRLQERRLQERAEAVLGGDEE